MRFKTGQKVEVLSKKEGSTGSSWLSAELISGNGHTYSIRYVSFPRRIGEAVVERVSRKAIRPCPPSVEGANNWVPGDHLEVFQSQNTSWKKATVVKALGGNNFLVRPLGQSREFRVHRSHLRVQQSWQDGKWIVVGKQRDAHCTMSMKKNQNDTNTKQIVREDHFHEAKYKGIQEPRNSARTLKRASSIGGDRLPFRSTKQKNKDTDSFCSDVEPFRERWYEEKECLLSKIKELAAQDRDHRLELKAYRNVMKALYASGPLSWKDEMKVTDLRLALHISNDEHLLELRNLISADTAIPIC